MCGLVGAFRAKETLFPLTVKNFITQGLYVSALRGMSGTGVALIDKDFSPDMVKTHVDAGNFIFTDKYDWVEKNAPNSRAILGHTRAPTGGAGAAMKNSHPFWYGDQKAHKTIMGTHNGHVNNAMSLTPTNFHHPVDSAHVFYSMYLNKAMPTLEKISGYYVLIWYDEHARTLNMARNTHRELYLARNKAKTIVYYASEEAILEFALERTSQEWDKEFGFMELQPHTLYSWDLEEVSLEHPDEKKYNEKKAGTEFTHHGGSRANGGFKDKWGSAIDYSKAPVLPDTPLFVYVKDPDKAFQSYVNNKEGSTEFGKPTPWGKVYGSRLMDQGLVVIEGVLKSEWDTKWKHIWQAIPVKCTSSCYESHGEGAAKKTYPSYKVMIDLVAADRDFARWQRDHDILEGIEKKGNSQNVTVKLSNVSRASSGSSKDEITLVAGPGKTMIPLKEWREIAKEGCVICHGTIIDGDIGSVLFYEWQRCPEDRPEDSEHLMICPMCVQNPDNIQKALGFIPV